jgi:hypothetical protein
MSVGVRGCEIGKDGGTLEGWLKGCCVLMKIVYTYLSPKMGF